MEIKKVYATSKGGLFWSKDEAEKPKNRGKDFNNPYYVGESLEYHYEPVREVYVLIADVEVDAGARGFGNVTMAFELKPVEIQ
jgi:hypothetical protein